MLRQAPGRAFRDLGRRVRISRRSRPPYGLDDARDIIDRWLVDYNEQRPHTVNGGTSG
jgi:transposase InsO family protein